MVDVLDILRRYKPEVFKRFKLVIVGGGRLDGDFEKNREVSLIRSRLKDLKMQEKVLFLGSREQEDLYKYYSAADALLFPTLYESFGLVVGEAMACGTPVLVSGVGEMGSFVLEGKNGYTFAAADPSAAVEAIIRFDKERNFFWADARIRSHVLKKLNWEKTAARIHREFLKLRGVRPQPTTISLHDENLQPM
jgi:glycosyltransferase involved in cell wall biosynthesis